MDEWQQDGVVLPRTPTSAAVQTTDTSPRTTKTPGKAPRTPTVPKRRAPVPVQPSGPRVTLASNSLAFDPLTAAGDCQLAEFLDEFRPLVRIQQKQQQSAGSSTDVSQSASSTTSVSEDNTNRGNLPSDAARQTSLFHAIVRMIALAEGGILEPDDPEFGFAANDAHYGILINKTHRLVYTPQLGLNLVEFIN